MRSISIGALICFVAIQAAVVEVQAQAAPKKAAGSNEWHTVGTVMQLDLLPKDARWVESTRGDAEFLEFVAELPQFEALRFTREVELSRASLKALAGAASLQILDLSGAVLPFELSDELIEPLRALKILRIDLNMESVYWCGTDGMSDEERASANAKLTREALAWSAKFRERGGRIDIGRLTAHASMIVGLREELPAIDSITLAYGDDAALRELARFSSLERIALDGGEVTELGFACLARCETLKSLSCSDLVIGQEVLHHLAKFKALARLEIFRCSSGWKHSEFQRLFNLKAVKDLVVDDQLWNELPGLSEQELHSLGGSSLESLSIAGEPLSGSALAAGIGFFVGARRIELKLYGLDAIEVPEIAAGQAQPRMQELVLHLSAETGENLEERAKRAADMLARYPSLKRLSIDVQTPDASWDAVACQKALKAALPKVEVSVR